MAHGVKKWPTSLSRSKVRIQAERLLSVVEASPSARTVTVDPVGRTWIIQPEISVPLERLEATADWWTRCVEVLPQQAATGLNLWVTGSDFAIGIDALRLGPSCD